MHETVSYVETNCQISRGIMRNVVREYVHKNKNKKVRDNKNLIVDLKIIPLSFQLSGMME